MAASFRVLYVDDSGVASRAAAALERAGDGFTVVPADGAGDGRDRLHDDLDCVVSGLDPTTESGRDFVQTVRQEYPSLPLLFAAAPDGGSAGWIADEGDSPSGDDSGADAGAGSDADARTDSTDEVPVPEPIDRLADRVAAVVCRPPLDRQQDASVVETSGATDLLDSILEQVPIHMFVKDRQARHLWVSSHYADETPTSPDADERLGKTDLELFQSEFARQTYRDDLAVISTGDPIVDRAEYVPVTGEWNLTTKVPWYDDGDSIRGLIGVTRRITKRKEYETCLERQNERLDEFASIVSHDLRNPLTVAIGHLDLARENRDSEHLRAVARSLDRMETLVEDLLALARRGEAALEPEPVRLEAAARRCWESVATGGATLRVETDRAVVADRSRLRQLLENLFRNAVEHGSTSPGSSATRQDPVEHGLPSDGRQSPQRAPDAVTGDADASGDDTAALTVTVGDLPDGFYVADDGVGIAEEERATIFESGYSTEAGNTGYGLSIVERTADAHGWATAASESDAGGARFDITGVDVP